MSVELLKADLARLRQDVDGFYDHLATPLTALGELGGRWAQLTQGSSRDASPTAGAFSKVRGGFHAVEDGLIELSLAIDSYASGL